MAFQVLTQKRAATEYKKLWSVARHDFQSFPGFDFFYHKLFTGNFTVLKNRYDAQVFALYRDQDVVALATHLKAKSDSWGMRSALAAVLFRNDISDKELQDFYLGVKDLVGNESLVGPINGHIALGVSLPDQDMDPKKISVLTAAATSALQRFFTQGNRFKPTKKYFALSVKHSEALEVQLKQEIAHKPAGISTRPISKLHFKRDISIYHRLVNECMKDHPLFHKLEEAEEWELMKMSWTMIHPDYFQFLMKDGNEIGFCFGMPDYNPYLKVGSPDLVNFVRLLWAKERAKKGRVIYSGILPKYRGEKLFKFVRHEVLLAMFRNGIREIESSYVDETNNASLGNVRSTNAEVSHTFSLYGLCD